MATGCQLSFLEGEVRYLRETPEYGIRQQEMRDKERSRKKKYGKQASTKSVLKSSCDTQAKSL